METWPQVETGPHIDFWKVLVYVKANNLRFIEACDGWSGVTLVSFPEEQPGVKT